MSSPLAAIEDIEALLHRQLEATELEAADFALKSASAAIRSYTRQQVDLVTNDTLQLRGSWSDELYLPQLPVTNVASLAIRSYPTIAPFTLAPSQYTWDRMGLVRFVGAAGIGSFQIAASDWGYWGGADALIDVVYSHGYASVPDDIASVCATVAYRVFTNPQGLLSESNPDYSVRYSRVNLAELTDGEKEELEDYRRRVASASVT